MQSGSRSTSTDPSLNCLQTMPKPGPMRCVAGLGHHWGMCYSFNLSRLDYIMHYPINGNLSLFHPPLPPKPTLATIETIIINSLVPHPSIQPINGQTHPPTHPHTHATTETIWINCPVLHPTHKRPDLKTQWADLILSHVDHIEVTERWIVRYEKGWNLGKDIGDSGFSGLN